MTQWYQTILLRLLLLGVRARDLPGGELQEQGRYDVDVGRPLLVAALVFLIQYLLVTRYLVDTE